MAEESPSPKPAKKNRLGKFELVRILGKGGMGTVYEATCEGSADRFAIKVLHPSLSSDKEILTRFEREVKAGQALDHPGIVKIYDVGQDKGRYFFAMQFVEGTPLDELIDGEGLAPEESAALIRDAALALHHAHEHGITHRDIKPNNIIRASDSTVFLTDFGIAREATAATLTADGQVIGTPFYMSPEQATGQRKEIGPASDVYSLGITFYELLTRTTPFRGENIHQIFHNVLRKDPLPVTQVAPAVPKPLETIVMKAIRKEVSKRYPSALALAEDIDRFLEGRSVEAKPMTGTERFVQAVRRHKGLSAMIALGVVLVTAFAVVLAAGAQAARARAEEAAREREAKVAKLVEEGTTALEAGDFGKAREALEMALSMDKENADAARALAAVQAAKTRAEEMQARREAERKARTLAREGDEARAAFEEAHRKRTAFFDRLEDIWETSGYGFESHAVKDLDLSLRSAGVEAEEAAARALDLYAKALLLDPHCEEARRGTASIRMDQCALAFREGLHTGEMREAQRLLLLAAQHDEEGYHETRRKEIEAWMRWEQTVDIRPTPPVDDIRVLRVDLEKNERTEVKEFQNGRGRLPPGSYIAALESPGHVETNLPFVVEWPASEEEKDASRILTVSIHRKADKYEGMVYVPAGPFVMGGGGGVRGGATRTVELPAFFIDRCEVTCAAYEAFLADLQKENPSLVEGYRPKFQLAEGDTDYFKDQWGKARSDPFRMEDWNLAWFRHEDGSWHPPDAVREFPVGGVSFEAAQAFARHHGKRLPTSEEWEKAARGVDGRRYPWGNRFDEHRVSHQQNPDPSVFEGWRRMHPADSLPEGMSPYGCLHMASNISEWTDTDIKGDHKINRGGCPYDEIQMMRCASIDYTRPADRNSSLGFRCVRDPE